MNSRRPHKRPSRHEAAGLSQMLGGAVLAGLVIAGVYGVLAPRLDDLHHLIDRRTRP